MKKSEMVEKLKSERNVYLVISLYPGRNRFFGIHSFNYGDDVVCGQVCWCGEIDTWGLEFDLCKFHNDYVDAFSDFKEEAFDYISSDDNMLSEILGREIDLGEDPIEEEIEDLYEEFCNKFDNDEIEFKELYND
jgi:hypothetical protein